MSSGKRTRPSELSADDRPSKRLSLTVQDLGHRPFRQLSRSANSSRHPSEDWVLQANMLSIDSPLYPPPSAYPSPQDLAVDRDGDMVMESDDTTLHGDPQVAPLHATSFHHSLNAMQNHHTYPLPQLIVGTDHSPRRHHYETRYAERTHGPLFEIAPPNLFANAYSGTPEASFHHQQQLLQQQQQQHSVDVRLYPPTSDVLESTVPATAPNSPTAMAVSPSPSFAQLPTLKRRLYIGPRANCEKCRLGVKGHYAHYE